MPVVTVSLGQDLVRPCAQQANSLKEKAVQIANLGLAKKKSIVLALPVMGTYSVPNDKRFGW